MKYRQMFIRFVIGLMLAAQVTVPITVRAASGKHKPTPTPTATATPTPSDTPDATATPSPTASPSATPAPSDSPTPTSSPTASGSPTPTASASPAASGANPTTGPNKPTGTIPTWVFNTGTQKWEKADKDSFTWDAATGYWLSPKYFYDTRIGWYEIIPSTQAASLPSYMITSPDAQVVHTPLGDVVVGSQDYQVAKMLGLIGPDGTATGSAADAADNASANGLNASNGWIDFTSLVNVMNQIQSVATTGDSNVSGNTNGGDAVSGAANVVANLFNLLASAWSWSQGNLAVLMQNIFGDQTGDIMLQPSATSGGGGQLGSSATTSGTGPDSTNNAAVNGNTNLDVNAQNTGNISNDVNVAALSGNADVGGNTNGGSATSGDATAEVNIINMINSFINSGSSFFAMLNIFGNLNGDILFPDGFLNGLLSSSGSGSSASDQTTGPGSSNDATVNGSSNANLTAANSSQINNNIDATATSGAANTSGNTSAGSATTGAASTNQSLFNLDNSSIFGDNAVLVIVNVMGHWVGKIMNVGDGTSESALLGGNATETASNSSTGPDSTNNAAVNGSNNVNANLSNSGTITNNVTASANSGNANVSGNTTGGNATSGTAKVATNVANIVNSALNVKHWFGVLVINVFGNWFGSVNQNTSAGDASTSPVQSSAPTAQLIAAVMPTAFGSASTTTNQSLVGSGVSGGNGATGVVVPNSPSAVLAASTIPNQAKELASGHSTSLMFALSALVMLIAGALFSIERKLRR